MSGSGPPIVFGSFITVDYRICLADGTEVDSSHDEGGPVSFALGDGSFPDGVELILYGMRTGQSDRRELQPLQAWGERDPARVEALSRGSFPSEMTPREGQIIAFQLEDGEEVAGAIVEVGDERVLVDFNPPLAGQTVSVEFDVLDVQPPAVDPLAGL